MAMDFGAARDRVRQLIASKKPSELSNSALRPDALRDNIIEETGAHTERFKHALRRKPEVEFEHTNEDGTKEQKSYSWDGYGDALRDVARAGFDFSDPQLLGQDKVKASRQINRELLRDYMHSPSFDDSRPYTQGNGVESVFGALAASKSLQESAKTRLSEHIARSEDMREEEERAQSAQDMMEQLRNRARQDVKDDGTVSDDTRRGIKQAIKQGEKAEQNLVDLLNDQAGSSFAQDVRAAANEAADEAAESVDALSNLPGLEPGEAHNLSPDQQIELAEAWAANPDLKKIAEMLGRMMPMMARARAARSKNVPVEPVGVTTGRHLERLLPHEMARMHIPALRVSFVKDFAEHSLLEYEMSGKEPLSKGPIIPVHDGSGSMNGEKFVWASSLALTLFKIAQREKRAFAGVEFGSPNQCKSWFFPKGETADPMKVLDYASHFFGGGTSTVTGMAEALRIVRDVPAFSTADIVLIGDGQDHFRDADQKVRDQLLALDVRIHGITIMTNANPYFEQMCEWHVDVTELAASNEATEQLAEQIS